MKSNKQFPNSKPRWWNSKSLEQSEPPSFQPWQHDPSLGRSWPELVISPGAMAEIYGDNSLERHVEKLLGGIHEKVYFTLSSG